MIKLDKDHFRNHIRNLKEENFKSNDKHYYSSSLSMTNNILSFSLYQEANKVGYFASKKQSHEIYTDDIINHGLSNSKQVFLPRCIPKSKDLEFLEINNLDSDTEIAHFSIREPKKTISIPDQNIVISELEMLFVPGMAFYIKNGKRLGFGSGYYDKFIAKLKKINTKVKLIGLAFDFQIFSDPIPYNDDDSRVEYIISPTRTIQINI